MILSASCLPGQPLSLSLYEEVPCSAPRGTIPADINVTACGIVCQAVANYPNQEEIILNSKGYGLQLHSVRDEKVNVYSYTLTDEDIFVPKVTSETKNHQTLKNNERYTTSIRKLSKNSYFFPAGGVLNFTCAQRHQENVTDEVFNCLYGVKDKLDELGTRTSHLKIEATLNELTGEDSFEERKTFGVQYLMDSKGKKHNNTCLDGLRTKELISISIPLNGSKNDMLELSSCAIRCIATSPRKKFCTNENEVIEYDVTLTFWTYLAIRVFIGIIGGTAYTMFEGAVIASLREYKADYGLQRVYASIGGMISSPLSGWMIDHFSEGKGYTDFRYDFRFFFLTLFCALYSVCTLDNFCSIFLCNFEFNFFVKFFCRFFLFIYFLFNFAFKFFLLSSFFSRLF